MLWLHHLKINQEEEEIPERSAREKNVSLGGFCCKFSAVFGRSEPLDASGTPKSSNLIPII